MRSENLFLNITKYEFYIIKVLYLGFIISIYDIKIDPTKIKTIIASYLFEEFAKIFKLCKLLLLFYLFLSILVMSLVDLTKKKTV